MELKNAINTLLDEAKEKAGFKADNELALAIGISRQTINGYRKGRSTPDDYAKSKIADMTGRSLQEVIARIELENEPNEEKRKYWQNFFKRLGGFAASFIAAVIMIMTPYPAEAAQLHKVSNPVCILCKVRRLIRRIKTAATALRNSEILIQRHYCSG